VEIEIEGDEPQQREVELRLPRVHLPAARRVSLRTMITVRVSEVRRGPGPTPVYAPRGAR